MGRLWDLYLCFTWNNHASYLYQKMFHVKHCPACLFDNSIPIHGYVWFTFCICKVWKTIWKGLSDNIFGGDTNGSSKKKCFGFISLSASMQCHTGRKKTVVPIPLLVFSTFQAAESYRAVHRRLFLQQSTYEYRTRRISTLWGKRENQGYL